VEKQSEVVPVSSKKGAITLSWDKLILEQVGSGASSQLLDPGTSNQLLAPGTS
jgi:hypothetical protein